MQETIKTIKLSQIKVNAENPRTITGDKFQKLVNSILVFPKMLGVRPIVINKQYKALGGNMRTNGLNYISKLTIQQIEERLSGLADYQRMTDGEKRVLTKHWESWLGNPTVLVNVAEKLSPSEQQQFIIKDNVSFGNWDFDKLANAFDEKDLGDWGMDVWQPMDFGATPAPTTATPSTAQTPSPSYPADSEDDGEQFAGTLPPELQGVDLTPADLPKIEGSDETAMERIIIVYSKEQRDMLMNLLGITSIDKVVYRLDEILPSE